VLNKLIHFKADFQKLDNFCGDKQQITRLGSKFRGKLWSLVPSHMLCHLLIAYAHKILIRYVISYRIVSYERIADH